MFTTSKKQIIILKCHGIWASHDSLWLNIYHPLHINADIWNDNSKYSINSTKSHSCRQWQPIQCVVKNFPPNFSQLTTWEEKTKVHLDWWIILQWILKKKIQGMHTTIQFRMFPSLNRNIKIKICRTKMLLVILYGCETWPFTLTEEHRLRVN
jgi:hypothetical protein